MRRLGAALVAVAVMATLAAIGATGTRGAPTTGQACGPASVQGVTVVTHCGPARATFVFAGKTYRVSGGKCDLTKALGVTAWALSIGRQALPPAKPRFLEFHGASVGKPKAGTFTKGEYTLSFAVPGTAWSIAPGLPHKVTVTAGAKHGTFTGRFYTGSKNGTKPASGSWTC